MMRRRRWWWWWWWWIIHCFCFSLLMMGMMYYCSLISHGDDDGRPRCNAHCPFHIRYRYPLFHCSCLVSHDHGSVNMVYCSLYLCCSYRVCSTVCHMFVDQYECCHMFLVCHMLENAVKRWHRGLSNLRDRWPNNFDIVILCCFWSFKLMLSRTCCFFLALFFGNATSLVD